MLTIRTLGKFQIRDEEHIVNEEEIRSPKMINLLAYLILHRNQTLTFYDMADALWQEEETGNPAGALKNLMYRLRVLLKKNFGEEDFILTDHVPITGIPDWKWQWMQNDSNKCLNWQSRNLFQRVRRSRN